MSELLVGHLIAQARKEKGFSQRDLARLLQMDNAYISRIEANDIIPGRVALVRLCKKLELSFPATQTAVKESLYLRWKETGR